MDFNPEIKTDYERAEDFAEKAEDFFEEGDNKEALKMINFALEINPYKTIWYFNRGVILSNMSLFEESLADFLIVIKESPDKKTRVISSISLSKNLARAGKLADAKKILQDARENNLFYDSNSCYCIEMLVCIEMGFHEEAEVLFYESQEINPDCPLCFYNIGVSCFMRAMYAQSARCFERATKIFKQKEWQEDVYKYCYSSLRWSCLFNRKLELGEKEPPPSLSLLVVKDTWKN
ncbi:tetratricopeptide repeat protein [Patescibacteria group bacterium]|nr:tetratricopeptide repeat protein [Patescibacteria group bacterium]